MCRPTELRSGLGAVYSSSVTWSPQIVGGWFSSVSLRARWTRLAIARDGADAVAAVWMYASPANHSAGPLAIRFSGSAEL